MWPHSFVLALDGDEVCVGTDDADLVRRFAPWAVDRPDGLVDYGIELHPVPAGPRMPRVLPNLRHGSDYLVAAPDPEVLADGLARILAASARPVAEHEVLLGAVPVVHGDAVELMTPMEVSRGSYRQLARRGRRPVLVDRVAIDPIAGTARIPAPLDSDEADMVLPIRSLRVDGEAPDGSPSTATHVARLAPRLLSTGVDETAADLVALATLLHRLPPDYTGSTR